MRSFADMFLLLHPLWKGIGYGRVEAPVKFVEKRVKGFMFDCRMCGQCVLSSTGMSCPMNCPKQLRNGPCGGVRANGNCEVEPDMPCVWVKAWEGSRNMVKGDAILERAEAGRPVAARDLGLAARHRAGRRRAREAPRREPRHERSAPRQRDENPAGIHLPLEPLPGHSSRGRLERVLRRGEFAVTAELNPPDSANPEDVYNRAKVFDGWVDGINAVDASGANCHMSSVGICALLTRMGYAPIMQIACRDKNRIAIQGDVLGGAAMGVANMLCLTGDGVQAGDQPGAKPVFDLDCMSLLETIRIMRDNGKFLSGRKLTTPPQLFLGAAINPFAPPYRFPPASSSARRSPPARSSCRASTASTCRCSAPSCSASRDLGHHRESASSCAASARWPRPRPPNGSAPTCPASTFPMRSSSGWKARRTRRRKASGSASTSSTR